MASITIRNIEEGVKSRLASARQAPSKNAKHAINQLSINQGRVTELMVFILPVALQSAFAESLQRIDALTRHLDAAAAKAAWLSAEMFSGTAIAVRRDAA